MERLREVPSLHSNRGRSVSPGRGSGGGDSMERLHSIRVEEGVKSEGVKPTGSANGGLLQHGGGRG